MGHQKARLLYLLKKGSVSSTVAMVSGPECDGSENILRTNLGL